MKAVLITSSILIVLIVALRPILRGKLDPRVQYALWLAVALRLLIPVNLVTSAYSALALLERTEQSSVTQTIENIGQTTVPIPAMSYGDAYDQALREYQQNRPAVTSFTDMDEVTHRAQELQAQRPTLAELAQRLARPVWLGGAALMGLWFLLVNLRLRWKLRFALSVAADCPLPVYVTQELPSPCLCGAVRPKIYVTPAALTGPNRLRHVLAHEFTHYHHRDHWWALVRCLCLCLYWFDPLVWWAAALSRQDCELACDEGAIRRLGEGERIPYGRTLVSMIAAGRTSLMQTATTMTGGKRRVRERVQLIAQKPKTAIAVALALTLIVGCAVGCTFTGAPENSQAQLTLDTLRDRLMNIPEELKGKVMFRLISDKPGHLADYWLDTSDGWIDLGGESGHLMSVHQISREELLEQMGTVSYGRDWFARSGDDYFVLYRSDLSLPSRSDDPNLLYGYSEAICTYAMEQVLATEGVEPLNLEEWMADPDTLQDRLRIIPPWMYGDVTILPMEQAVDADFLVSYWLDRDWTNLDNSGLGWLLSVQQMSEADYMAHISNGGWEPIARNGGTYYAIVYATDVRFYSLDDAEPFHNAFDAIREYAIQQVLATEGTVPLLADSPATDKSALGYAARDAYVAALENLLYHYTTPDGEHWTPYSEEYPGGFEDMSQNTFALADVDGDGRAELVLMTRPNIYAGYRGYILDYDASADTIRIQHEGFPSFTFYSNGALAEDASHAQGSWTDTFWPHFLYIYLPETDSYELTGYVDAWEKSVSDRNPDALPPFPADKDISGAGILYYITPSEDLGDNFNGYSKDPVDKSVYQAWLEPHLGDAQPLNLEYFPLTEESINRLKQEIFP